MSWREELSKLKPSGDDGTRCPKCGKNKKPEFDLCYDCGQASRGPRRTGGGGERTASPPARLPDALVFDTFYNAEGKLRPGIFYEAPLQVAELFLRAGVKPAPFRRLYQGFLGFAGPLRDGRMDFETARERFGVFYVERVVRQVQRGFMPGVVADVIDRHRDLALSKKLEMLGLFRYVTNILCYFGDKEESRAR